MSFLPEQDLRHIRRSSDAAMTDSCVITRSTETTAYDPETGDETRGVEGMYEGRCSVSYPQSRDSIDRLFGGNPSVAPTANATVRVPPPDDSEAGGLSNEDLARMMGQAEELSGEVTFSSKIGTGSITMNIDMILNIQHGHTRTILAVKLGFPPSVNTGTT